MKVTSVRGLYECDHSSSTYHFVTSRRLTIQEKTAVQRLCHAPHGYSLEKTYMGEREMSWKVEQKLLTRFYEVEVSESYDWWTTRMTFDSGDELWGKLHPCDGRGGNDLGIDVEQVNGKIIVSLHFAMDYDAAYQAFGEHLFPGLADLFMDIREEIISGDISTLVVVARFYEMDAEADWSAVKQVSKNAKQVERILDRV